MPPLKPGFYCYLARDKDANVALDRYGPFETEDDLFAWCEQYHIDYRPDAPFFARAPLFFEEMSEGEAGEPWATGAYFHS